MLEFRTLNNCDEVISFLLEYANSIIELPEYNYVDFQEDKVPYGTFSIPTDSAIFIFDKHVFFVSNIIKVEVSGKKYEYIILCVAEDQSNISLCPGIMLPKYIHNELIAILKGEW